jgi:hypothetical protein
MKSIVRTVRRAGRRLARRVARTMQAIMSPATADPEAGMTTAELLGNAALGIAALVAIWAVMQTLGLDVVDWIRGQLRV